jgi:hypothetical protein
VLNPPSSRPNRSKTPPEAISRSAVPVEHAGPGPSVPRALTACRSSRATRCTPVLSIRATLGRARGAPVPKPLRSTTTRRWAAGSPGRHADRCRTMRSSRCWVRPRSATDPSPRRPAEPLRRSAGAPSAPAAAAWPGPAAWAPVELGLEAWPLEAPGVRTASVPTCGVGSCGVEGVDGSRGVGTSGADTSGADTSGTGTSGADTSGAGSEGVLGASTGGADGRFGAGGRFGAEGGDGTEGSCCATPASPGNSAIANTTTTPTTRFALPTPMVIGIPGWAQETTWDSTNSALRDCVDARCKLARHRVVLL